MEATSTFLILLAEFQCVFTKPTFATFLRLMSGWVLSHRRRFVTELIWSSGSTRTGHHSKYHRFFSKSVWELDTLSWVLAKLLVGRQDFFMYSVNNPFSLWEIVFFQFVSRYYPVS
jgi:hypothetical protein